MAVSLPVASKPATGDDGAVSSTTYWIVLLCFVLFSVANIIVTYVCALLKPPTRGVCDSYCNCTPIVVKKICLKQVSILTDALLHNTHLHIRWMRRRAEICAGVYFLYSHMHISLLIWDDNFVLFSFGEYSAFLKIQTKLHICIILMRIIVPSAMIM